MNGRVFQGQVVIVLIVGIKVLELSLVEGNIAYKSVPVQLQAHRGAVVCQGHRDGAAAFPGKAEEGAGISCHVVIGKNLLGFQ